MAVGLEHHDSAHPNETPGDTAPDRHAVLPMKNSGIDKPGKAANAKNI